MKRILLILTIIISNVTLFSCSTPKIVDEIGIEEVATEGEDEEILPDEDGN
ncbi:hypothetical protein [Aquimarina sediminis]|uniref:hypothetical protein n=1 Tax=Aquimarina sediminis TaxID=2070536 RepID=UPI0013E8A4B5|nr:hypothetical protein [Aquimarina sediminis]